jgi:hypothetical protein
LKLIFNETGDNAQNEKNKKKGPRRRFWLPPLDYKRRVSNRHILPADI